MSRHEPNLWVVLKVSDGEDSIFKVLGSWRGGYLDGDSWRLNSGITRVEREGDLLLFHGRTGSVYVCHEQAYGVSGYTSMVFSSWKEKTDLSVEMLPEETDWESFDWDSTRSR